MDVASVDGTTVTFKEAWAVGKVPHAGDHYYFAPVNPNVTVTETDQVDTLNLFNQNSPQMRARSSPERA